MSSSKEKKEIAIPAYFFRTQLGAILNAVALDRKFIVTHRGKPAGIFLNLSTYTKETGRTKSIQETLEILSEECDPDFQQSLRKAKKEMLNGKYFSLQEVRKKLRE